MNWKLKNQMKYAAGLLLIILLLISGLTYAQDPGETNDAELAKATQNPLAAMYSLPIQNNTSYGNADPHIFLGRIRER